MFDEQPDGDKHGECAAAIHELLDFVQSVANLSHGLIRAEANKLLKKHGRVPVSLSK